MEAAFWHKMWKSGVVGFHQQAINPFLLSYWSSLKLTGQEKILVPLCGKSKDMLWLAKQGHAVVGIELHEPAVNDFFSEAGLESSVVDDAVYKGRSTDVITLLQGDFFASTSQHVKGVKAIYDRAALVALPANMRQDYVAHLFKILPNHPPMLLVAMEYDQTQTAGPPFSVPEIEVRGLFESVYNVKVLATETFARKGVETTEKAYLLTRK